MAATQSGPTKRKRRLGQLLRSLREEREISVDAVMERLHCSDATVSRFETGKVLIKHSDLEILLAFYTVDDEIRTRALDMWEDAAQRGKQPEFLNALPRKFRSYVKLEAEASRGLFLQPLLVPGLLQTEPYSHAVHTADQFVAPEGVDKSVAARVSRQRLLTGRDPLHLHAVIDEAVIRRVIGGPDIMREQLQRLLELGEWPNVTIQVLPFGAGAIGTMSGPVTILEFPDPEDPPNVYLEHPAGGEWVEDPDAVSGFMSVFDGAVAAALSASESAALISAAIADLA
ncbi:helix-turn-helix domain-containing protein [Solihabitans fulvus]|uniref:Helix-turn-helix domain-containing protein n=1 Tax=Solihabitans fulvus TaxID=1892852 RepID=A0A5B2XTH0_9PSEU|nr:helix-turn-helix transcriptional regulator [Solihabitans fulvus]KAA2266987.1 helix-turn-helix domain-containing protein [Solihabitans fulvus]